MGATAALGQPGTLKMDPGDLPVLHQLGQDRDGPPQLVSGSGDQATEHGRGAARGMECHGALGVAIITGSEGTASPTVHMDIDETRYDQLLPKISGGFRGLATPNPCDPASIDAQPAW